MADQPNLTKGSLYVLGAFFFMAIFGVLTKAASAHGFELWVSFITYLTGAIVMLPVLFRHGLSFLKTQHFGYHFGRAAFGVTASFLYMLSMQYIPMVNATLLFNTTPIFIPLISMLFLGALITKRTWMAIVIGFIGIIVIIKPSEQIFTQPGNLIGLASGIFLAVAYVLIKKLSPTDPALRIAMYFFILATFFQLPLLFFAGMSPDLTTAIYSALAGIAMVLAQVCLAEGYRYADASKVGVYQYTTLIYVGVIDWVVWHVIPPPIDLLGVLLVLIAGVIIIRSGNEIQCR